MPDPGLVQGASSEAGRGDGSVGIFSSQGFVPTVHRVIVANEGLDDGLLGAEGANEGFPCVHTVGAVVVG